MKNHISTLLLAGGLILTLTSTCFSQQDTTSPPPVRLVLADGSELIGSITAEDSLTITFRTIGNISMVVPKNQVKTRELLTGKITGGEYVRQDPNHTRLLFVSNGRPLKSGQGYFAAYEIFFPFAAVGIGEIVTLAGGISLAPGATNQIYYFAPMITPYHTDQLSLGAGMLYVNTTAGSSDGVGIYYGVGTFGSNNASITAGVGWGFYGSDVSDRPAFLIGGELRASNSIKFVTENWLVPNADVNLLSFGIRFFGENIAADLGFVYPAGADMGGFPFLPWLGFVYNFGASQ